MVSQNVILWCRVRPFSKPILREFWAVHPQAQRSLLRWWKTAELSSWGSLAEVRRDYPATDLVQGKNGDLLVFNVGGNKYRLIVLAQFGKRSVYILWVGTHAEYSRLNVKEL